MLGHFLDQCGEFHSSWHIWWQDIFDSAMGFVPTELSRIARCLSASVTSFAAKYCWACSMYDFQSPVCWSNSPSEPCLAIVYQFISSPSVITVYYSYQRTAVPDTLPTENAYRTTQYTKYIYLIDWHTAPHTHYKRYLHKRTRTKSPASLTFKQLRMHTKTYNTKYYNNYAQ